MQRHLRHKPGHDRVGLPKISSSKFQQISAASGRDDVKWSAGLFRCLCERGLRKVGQRAFSAGGSACHPPLPTPVPFEELHHTAGQLQACTTSTVLHSLHLAAHLPVLLCYHTTAPRGETTEQHLDLLSLQTSQLSAATRGKTAEHRSMWSDTDLGFFTVMRSRDCYCRARRVHVPNTDCNPCCPTELARHRHHVPPGGVPLRDGRDGTQLET